MNTCIDDLAPILAQAEQHPDHGGVMANDAIATFFDVSENSIRTLKKRLTDEQAIEQNRHWLSGENNRTLWTFRGFLRLGMRLSSPMALQLQATIEELLAMLNSGQVQIVPVGGQSIGVQLITVDVAPGELVPLVTDEAAIADALGAAKYAQERQQQAESVERIKTAAMARYHELKQGEQSMGEALAQSLGLSLEIVSNTMKQGAT